MQMILLDCLVYPSGPRIRDHVSHGEMSAFSISQTVANHVACTCAVIALKFVPQHLELVQVVNLLLLS